MKSTTPRRLLQAVLCCVAFWAGAELGQFDSAIAGESSSKPNIIVVMSDDQGYGDLHCHGNTMIRTPNLDRLHSESVRLTDFHVDPTCSPTRAALLTGRYSTRTGVWHTIMGRSLLYHDEVTLADVLATNGYRTAIFGKWHLGDHFPMRPEDRGFNEAVIHGGGGIGQTPDYWGNDYVDDHYQVNGEWKPFKGYCTDVFFDLALDFVRRNRERPFFLYLPVNVPHGPFIAPGDLSLEYRAKGVPDPMAAFYAMIENLDSNIGRLRQQLKEWNLERNTLFIFMTDNGSAMPVVRPGPSGSQDTVGTWKGFNAGMRAGKSSPFDGGHRVPCFIRWPAGGIEGGRDVSVLAAHFDLLPTITELAGLKFEAKNPLDGRSLVPLLRGRNADWSERTLFVHTQRQEKPPKWVQSAVLTERWRLIHGKELYDIQADPEQTMDIAGRHPEVVEFLRREYERWWTSLEPAFDRYGWMIIGSPKEPVATLNCMDWHAEQRNIPWNQGMIDRMPEANGYWMIEVARDGEYEFALRHKPGMARFPLQASTARVKVGEYENSARVSTGSDAVRVRLHLKRGRTKMQTWLADGGTGIERGAFYVEVRRVGD